jgi:hypothetical protein
MSHQGIEELFFLINFFFLITGKAFGPIPIESDPYTTSSKVFLHVSR